MINRTGNTSIDDDKYCFAGPTGPTGPRRILAFLVIGLIAALSACSEQQAPEPNSEATLADSIKSSSRPDQESENAQIFLYVGERISSDIRAEKIWKFSYVDSAIARGLSVDFYDTDGQIANHLTSDSGIILESRKMMIAIGNVVVTSSDSTTIYTEELRWNSQTQRITSDKYVTIVSGTDTLRGIGFETDRNMRSIKILKQVEGSLSEFGASE